MLRLGATPVCSRSSGTCAIPALIAARGSPVRRGTPPTRIAPAVSGRSPVTASASSRCPLPATPATPRIWPADTLSETSWTASTPRSPWADRPSSSSSTSPISRASSRRSIGVELAAHHQRGERLQRRPRRLDGGDGTAVAQHRDAVGDRHHLVQLVRDEDHRAPVGGHRPQRLEQRRRLLRGEHGGRLVEDQDARLAVERLQDLDALLLPDRELPDPRARVDRHPVALAELGHALLDRARVEAERAGRRRSCRRA